MKRPHLFTVGVMCCVLFFNTYAQLPPSVPKLLPEKPFLFGKLPEQFNVQNLWMENLFAGPGTGTVKIPIAANNFFEGTVIEKVQKNPYVITINVKSSNYDGALLSVSKITYDDLSVKYTGRIISIKYGDVFLIEQGNNELYFRRRKQSIVITE